MNIFLLDNEKSARETVKSYLKKFDFGEPIQIHEATNIEEGLTYFSQQQSDIAILDINLDEGTSFDMLSRLDQIPSKIVFISAYDQYAIKAFKFNALDYILKPINPLEFNAALEKSLSTPAVLPAQLDGFKTTITQKNFDKVILRDSQSIHFVSVDDIIQCKSENNYTIFSTKEGAITISKTLGEYEMMLREKGFFRSHRSHLINLNQIKRFDKKEGGQIQMTNGENVPLARNKRDIFMKIIERM
ncbi:MAG: LytR/AlgR family response regulator transcription factor [Ekhidna sp.]